MLACLSFETAPAAPSPTASFHTLCPQLVALPGSGAERRGPTCCRGVGIGALVGWNSGASKVGGA